MYYNCFVKTFLCIIFISLSFKVNCQNLIINPSFEEYTKCPKAKLNNYIYTHDLNGWSGNGFYLNKCGYYNKEPRTGNGMVELVLFSNTPYLKPTTLIGTLNGPLIREQYYYFEMYVCYSTLSTGLWAIDAIGVGFVENSKKIDSVFDAQISNPKGKIITDSVNWTKIAGYYRAKGNEKYIVIGNFTSRKQVNYQTIRPSQDKRGIKKEYRTKSFNNASYYFDDLLLKPVSDSLYISDSCNIIKQLIKDN